MAANVTLDPVREHGWRMGFANLLRKELGDWWRTKSWITQVIIWTLLINGIVLAVLAAPSPDPATLPEGANDMGNPADGPLMIYTLFTGMAAGIGVIILMQDAIITEKQSGTAAWVLSKPVSRPAFILSKLVAHTVGVLVIMVLLQGVLAYILLTAAGGVFSIGNWLAGMGILALNLLFFLTLTLMLGTLYNNRGPVIGIPIGVMFLGQLVLGVLPQAAYIMPWVLSLPQNAGIPSLATQIMRSEPLWSVLPIIATAIWCVIFVAVAIWRFNRDEF
jgi:ABC-2 type transport system permease protein